MSLHVSLQVESCRHGTHKWVILWWVVTRESLQKLLAVVNRSPEMPLSKWPLCVVLKILREKDWRPCCALVLVGEQSVINLWPWLLPSNPLLQEDMKLLLGPWKSNVPICSKLSRDKTRSRDIWAIRFHFTAMTASTSYCSIPALFNPPHIALSISSCWNMETPWFPCLEAR